jgi:hypothetical protein
MQIEAKFIKYKKHLLVTGISLLKAGKVICRQDKIYSVAWRQNKSYRKDDDACIRHRKLYGRCGTVQSRHLNTTSLPGQYEGKRTKKLYRKQG